MSPRKASTQKRELDPLDEIARLLVMQIRTQYDTQVELTVALNKAGFNPTRIAALLGTSYATVNTDLQRAKKAKPRKRTVKKSSGGNES